MVRNIVDDARNADSGGYVLGVARVNGQIVNVTFAEAYELYTRLNSHEERQEVLAPDTEGDAFGACGVRDEMVCALIIPYSPLFPLLCLFLFLFVAFIISSNYIIYRTLKHVFLLCVYDSTSFAENTLGA